MGPLISARTGRPRSRPTSTSADVAFRGSAPEAAWASGTRRRCSAGDTATHRSFREEIFGPVVSVVRFSGESEAIAIANDSAYGLSGSIWTRDLARGLRVARAVDSGALSVNSNSSVRYATPFGGFKQSGIGRELGPDALLGFSEEKNVFISTED